MTQEERQECFLRAHYLQCYRAAQEAGFKALAQTIYEFYITKWPDEVLDWVKILGG